MVRKGIKARSVVGKRMEEGGVIKEGSRSEGRGKIGEMGE